MKLEPGKIVRYSSGSTAIMMLLWGDYIGWYGWHCLGGRKYALCTAIQDVTAEEAATWRPQFDTLIANHNADIDKRIAALNDLKINL